MTAPTPEPTKGEQRQQKILVAARKLLVGDGYDRFVLREVAARVGITLGNLQYYYPTRDDLLEAVVRAEFERNRREIADLSSGKRAPHEKLRAIVRHLIEVWGHDGGRVYVVMSLLALHHERFARLHGEIYASFYDGLLPVLGEMRPEVPRPGLRRLARLVTTLIDGALVQVPARTFVADAVRTAIAIAESDPSA